MFLPISSRSTPLTGSLLALVLLGACAAESRDPVAQASEAAVAEGRKPDLVPCAIGTAKPGDCAREKMKGPDGQVWILRHRDGSFRRLAVLDAGSEAGMRITAADGADAVRSKQQAGFVEVYIGNEYYRFPNGDTAGL